MRRFKVFKIFKIKGVFLFAIAFFLLPANALATSVVAVRNGDEIVLGADSSTTLTQLSDGMEVQKNMQKCKIVQAGNFFFASAGFAGIGPARAKIPGSIYPEFNLKRLIERELAGGGKTRDKMDELERLLAINLSRIAEKARREAPAFFVEKFIRHPLFSLVIAGIDDGRPVLFVMSFRLNAGASGVMTFDIDRYRCPGDCSSPDVAIFAGETGAIRRYLSRNADFSSMAGPVEMVRSLVELEISKAPSAVGPPVDILRLSADGPQWVQKKDLCPEIQHTLP